MKWAWVEFYSFPRFSVLSACGASLECILQLQEASSYFLASLSCLWECKVSGTISHCLNKRVLRSKQAAEDRENSLWQINYMVLQKPKTKKQEHSFASASTYASSYKTGKSIRDRRRFEFFLLQVNYIWENIRIVMIQNETVVGLKVGLPYQLRAENKRELRHVRALSNEKLNKFIGISYDGPEALYFWRFERLQLIKQYVQALFERKSSRRLTVIVLRNGLLLCVFPSYRSC